MPGLGGRRRAAENEEKMGTAKVGMIGVPRALIRFFEGSKSS